MPTIRNRKRTLYGFPGSNIDMAQEPIIAERAPTTNDGAELGAIWVDKSANDFRILCDNTAGSFTWTGTTGGATTLTSLTVNPGNLVVTAGDATVSAGTTTVQDLVVNAGATITGNVGITGDVTITGDFDINDTGAITLTSTSNTNPAIYLHENGGVLGSIILRASQGTSASSVLLDSTSGGLTLLSGLASADAINLTSTNGGLDVDAALQINVLSTQAAANAIVIQASGGGMDILADGAGNDIDILSSAGSINVIGSEASATAVVIQADDAAGGVVISSGSNAISLNASVNQPTNINSGTSTGAVVIGNAAAGAISLDSAAAISIDAAAASNFSTSVGDLSLESTAGSVVIDGAEAVADAVQITASNGAGGVTVVSGSGAINLNASVNQPTNINTGTSTGAVDIGNAAAGAIGITTAAGVTIDAATASSFQVTGAAQDLTIFADGGSVKINSTENAAGAIALLSNGGIAETITITNSQGTDPASIDLTSTAGGITLTSNLATADGINLNAIGGGLDVDCALQMNLTSSQAAADAIAITASNAAGGISLNANGIVAVTPDTASVASPTASSTQNFRVIVATFTGFTTAAAASQNFTIVSSDILTTSGILVNVANLNASTNGALMTIDGVTQSAGQIVISTTNNGAGALGAGDDVLITLWVIS